MGGVELGDVGGGEAGELVAAMPCTWVALSPAMEVRER